MEGEEVDVVAAAGSRLAERPVAIPELERVLDRPRRLARFAAAAIGLVVVLAGIGVVQLASAKPEQAGVFEVVATTMSEVRSFTTEVRVTVGTPADQTPAGPALRWRAVFDVAADRQQATATIGSESYESRTVGGVIYLRFPPETTDRLGMETEWLAFPADSEQASGSGAPFPTEEPTDYFQNLAGLDASPRLVRTTAVRSITTRHYQVQLIGQRARRYLDRSRSQVFAGDADAPLRVKVSIWVDEDNLLRRRQTVVSGITGDETVTHTTTAELFDFNAEVPPIEAPPPDTVTHFDSADDIRTRLSENPAGRERLDLPPAASEHYCPASERLRAVIANLSPVPRTRAEVELAATQLNDALDAAPRSQPAAMASRTALEELAANTRILFLAMTNNSRSTMASYAERIGEQLDALDHNCGSAE